MDDQKEYDVNRCTGGRLLSSKNLRYVIGD